ncbi:MAG: GNAT family N-acetyltransferase [Clostridia bacterium]|nr:GNAT family N-acetyltransferase [Clostridia bacterium]
MVEYRKARPEEFDALYTFANMVFNHKNDPICFQRDLTKVYGPNADKAFVANMHHIAVDPEQGIRALIAALPGVLHLGNETLKTAFIGSVSVHMDARGEGHMKKLMQMVMDDAAANGADLLLLSGQRQRYGYFGFEVAGHQWTFEINRANARHALREIDASDFRFERIEHSSDSRLEGIYAAMSAQPIRFERDRAHLLEICESYARILWAVMRRENCVGYVISNADHSEWAEVGLSTGELLDAAAKAWLAQFDLHILKLSLPDWEVGLRAHLGAYSEDTWLTKCTMARILNPRRVLPAMLSAKAGYANLPDGELSLNVDGDCFDLRLCNGVATVESGNRGAALELSAQQLSRAAFAPFSYEDQPATPQGWFPLPIYASVPDTF